MQKYMLDLKFAIIWHQISCIDSYNTMKQILVKSFMNFKETEKVFNRYKFTALFIIMSPSL